MEENNRLLFNGESKSLDRWIDDTCAPVNEMIYLIMFELNRVLEEAIPNVR